MTHVNDASERCRMGSSPNMKDVLGKHFLPASKYWTNINENLSEVAEAKSPQAELGSYFHATHVMFSD